MTTSELKQQIEKVLGNSIRCLLPSYWWKRLFHQVADRIDEVEQSVKSKADKGYVDEAVSNVNAVTDSAMSDTSTNAVQNKVIKKYVDNKAGSCVVYFPISGVTLTSEQIRKNAESYQRLVETKLKCEVLVWMLLGYTKAISIVVQSNGIVIGTFESNAVLHEDGSVTSLVEQPSKLTFVTAFDALLNDTTTEQEKEDNRIKAQTYCYGIKNGKTYQIELQVFFRDSMKQYNITVYPSYGGLASLYNKNYWYTYGEESMVFANIDLGDHYAALSFDLILSPESGLKLIPHVELHGINLIHANIVSGVLSSEGLSTVALCQNSAYFQWGRGCPAAVYISDNHQLIPATLDNNMNYIRVYAGDYTFVLQADGTIVDSHVQEAGAVTKDYVDSEVAKKVDKVAGKQLSTEDFTSAFKTKLEGLNNYDDTSIQNAVNSLTTQINTLVSGDASVAIESFNEIIAFLNGVEDSESLDSIIASIEQQIAGKQDKISDLETIRSGAALGATALQEHQDISHLATKEEVTNLQNEVIANEEVSAAAFNEINDRINAISESVSGTTVTKEEFESTVTTINESIATKADATSTSESIASLEESVNGINTSLANYATAESLANEVETITNTIIENEEITATALNDLQSKIEDIYSKLNALGA